MNLDPLAIAEEVLGTIVVNFPHEEKCGLHALGIESIGRKVATPTEMRVRCLTCSATVRLPNLAYYQRAWNRRSDVPTTASVIDVEATIIK